jgi:hypothetical protein
MQERAIINYWVNHPAIVGHVAPGYGYLDASGFFLNPRNVMLHHPRGCMLFFHDERGYKGHYLFGDRLRGKEAKDVACKMVNTIFTRYKAPAIFGSILRGNRPARVMTRAIGLTPTGTVSSDNLGRPCVDYCLARETWERLPYKSAGCWQNDSH